MQILQLSASSHSKFRQLAQTAAAQVLGLSLLLLTNAAHAEKADRLKPIKVEANSNLVDQTTNVLTLEGDVILEQGTMRINAARMVVKRDAQEHIFAELFAKPGGQILFREKREGVNDYMEGAADRAEFDDKANTLKLFNRAKLKNGTDELSGEYIYYNSVTEVIQALGRIPDPKSDAKAAVPSGDNRVRLVIQPRQDAAKEPSKKPTGLAPETKK
jgi:lipopolysaccharide export system protein LptA